MPRSRLLSVLVLMGCVSSTLLSAKQWRVNLEGSGNRLESELVIYMAVFRIHCSPHLDSELGRCPRPFRKRYALQGVGAGTSAIRRMESWVSGLNQQFAKLPTLRGPVVRIHYSPQELEGKP